MCRCPDRDSRCQHRGERFTQVAEFLVAVAGRLQREPRADLPAEPLPCQVEEPPRWHYPWRTARRTAPAAGPPSTAAVAVRRRRPRSADPRRTTSAAVPPSTADRTRRPSCRTSPRACRPGSRRGTGGAASRGFRVRHDVRRPERLAYDPGCSAPLLRRLAAHRPSQNGASVAAAAGAPGMSPVDAIVASSSRAQARGGFGAVREGLLVGPDHDRRPVVPAVQRVAPVAHVARAAGCVIVRRRSRHRPVVSGTPGVRHLLPGDPLDQGRELGVGVGAATQQDAPSR